MPHRARGVRSLLRIFTDNLGLKAIAIIVSITLFSLVRGSEDAQRSIYVDVVALLPPPSSNKMLVSELPDKVKLTLRGSRSVLNSIRTEDIEPMQMDLREGHRRFHYFDPSEFDLPASVHIVQLMPATVPLTWATRIDKRLSIAPNLRGTLPQGLSVREPVEITPSMVTMRGPEQEVGPLTAIETSPIELAGLAVGVHTRRVGLESPPPHAQYIGDGVVNVALHVVQQMDERTLHAVAVSVIGNVRAETRPTRVEIRLRGPSTVMGSFAEDRVVPFVETGHLTATSASQSVRVQLRGLPEGIEVIAIEPAEVLVTPVLRGGTTAEKHRTP